MNFLYLLSLVIILASPSWASNLTRLGSSNYYVSASELTFVEALFMCHQQGMELISFKDMQDFVEFNNTIDAVQIDSTRSYWMGGLRLRNGLWYWMSTNTAFTYTDWGTSEPYCSSNSVCGVVLGSFDHSSFKEPRKWAAEYVTSEYLYICET